MSHRAVPRSRRAREPRATIRRAGDHNLGDFLLAVEGVSHFIYAVRCARARAPGHPSSSSSSRPRSTSTSRACSTTEPAPARARGCGAALFDDADYEPDLDARRARPLPRRERQRASLRGLARGRRSSRAGGSRRCSPSCAGSIARASPRSCRRSRAHLRVRFGSGSARARRLSARCTRVRVRRQPVRRRDR